MGSREGEITCEICSSGTPHFYCFFWLPSSRFHLLWLSATRAHVECNETAINALKADIQAMGNGEARTTASKEVEAAQQMMVKNDIGGCKSHIHSAMEATEK